MKKILIALVLLVAGFTASAEASTGSYYYWYLGGLGPKDLPFWAVTSVRGDLYVITDWYGTSPYDATLTGMIHVRRASDNRPIIGRFFFQTQNGATSTGAGWTLYNADGDPVKLYGVNVVNFGFELLYYTDNGQPFTL